GDGEDARAEGVGGFTDAGRGLERVLGKAEIGAIEIGEDIHQQEPRQQPQHGLVGGALGRIRSGGRRARFVECNCHWISPSVFVLGSVAATTAQAFMRSMSSSVTLRPKPGSPDGTSAPCCGTGCPGNSVNSTNGTPGGLPRKNSPHGTFGIA